MEELYDILRQLENKFGSLRSTKDEENLTIHADIRNWGEWQFPEDMECEDGEDEDCDYEELTEKSYQDLVYKVEEINMYLEERESKFQVTYSTSEKNYIDFVISERK